MKQLNPDGSVTVASGRPRTRRGPDSRGIRLCFQELGRSCSLKQGYLIFTDGSAYVYDAPSNEEIEALCASPIRGRQFNFNVRRALGGFVKGFTPPGDYQTIYLFPPYEGSAPTECPLTDLDWSDLFWSIITETPCGGEVWGWDSNGVASAHQRLGASNGTFQCTSNFSAQAILTYTTGGANSKVTLDIETSTQSSAWTVVTTVTVNGSVVLTDTRNGPSDFIGDVPFSMPDPMGATWTVQVDIAYTVNAGFGNVNFFANHDFAFA